MHPSDQTSDFGEILNRSKQFLKIVVERNVFYLIFTLILGWFFLVIGLSPVDVSINASGLI